MSEKTCKQRANYFHFPKTQYECLDCVFFLAAKDRCSLHKRDAVIHSYGSCNFFAPGKSLGTAPLGIFSKQQSNYGENPFKVGFSCKRCEYYGGHDCSKVDKSTTGDDNGIIHPDACCDFWDADPERSRIPDMVFAIKEAKQAK